MRKPKPLPEGAYENLAMDLNRAKSKAEFQRVQCIRLRASLGLCSDQVATAIGWHPGSVRNLQAGYLLIVTAEARSSFLPEVSWRHPEEFILMFFPQMFNRMFHACLNSSTITFSELRVFDQDY